MEAMMQEMATERPDGDGGMISLKQLGYIYVGLDDHWQNCTRVCANGTEIPSWATNNDFDYANCENNTGSTVLPWYDLDGNPQIDLRRFPDLKGMVAKAHDLGLRAGWYFGEHRGYIYTCLSYICSNFVPPQLGGGLGLVERAQRRGWRRRRRCTHCAHRSGRSYCVFQRLRTNCGRRPWTQVTTSAETARGRTMRAIRGI